MSIKIIYYYQPLSAARDNNFVLSRRNSLRTPPRPTGARKGVVQERKKKEENSLHLCITTSRFSYDTKVSRSGCAISSNIMR